VAAAARKGHEIACHSLSHRLLNGLSPADKQLEIVEGRRKIEQALNLQVRGFRAPGYSIDRECLQLLAAHGYRYDSSAYPTAAVARRLGVSVGALSAPGQLLPGAGLVELPLPDYRPFPFPFNPSYSLVLGAQYFKWGIARSRRHGVPLCLLFHLTDLAEPLPLSRLAGFRSKLFTLSLLGVAEKRRRCQEMLDVLGRHYDLTTTQAVLYECEHGAAAKRDLAAAGEVA
jgi:hypothetical protein